MFTATEIIAIRAPALHALPASEDFYIKQATTQTSLTAFGTDDLREQAIALRAMHRWTLDQPSGVGSQGLISTGPVVSLKEGDLAVGFAAPSSGITDSNPDLSRTPWGLELIQLIRSSIMGVRNRLTE